MPTLKAVIPRSTLAIPVVALIFYGFASVYGLNHASIASPVGLLLATALLPILIGTVFAAVHHAEVIALRIGEPYGTLVLTIAVTIIEVGLIVSVTSGGASLPALARDTVFSVIMIVGNGLVGLCILLGGFRYSEQGFRVSGANAYLVVLIVLATLTLILPNFIQARPGPFYSSSQLVFVALITLALYGGFLYIQTVRNRDYFLVLDTEGADASPYLPRNRAVTVSATILILSLGVVILLSKMFAAVVHIGTSLVDAPEAVVGVIVALLILSPESVAAVRAARRDQLQKSLNLALGSSLATISLTVPAVAALHLWLQRDLVLGLDGEDTVLLMLTAIVSLLTFGTGRTNILYGFVHLVIFAVFIFLVFVP
ncbi:calcium:proton antiporter [Microvirga thermotolerans]|uniref:Ionic transporter y4hA n=1 Tax=Microvirga thermotolerans TaxID=2651334 RepID=A0A5P9JSU1_9HYPH|nr:ionic transporter y4hA [Microvirga thermotolerans]QFU15159.1 ionic transporter y4hA [Microvirga thermotolerans]